MKKYALLLTVISSIALTGCKGDWIIPLTYIVIFGLGLIWMFGTSFFQQSPYYNAHYRWSLIITALAWTIYIFGSDSYYDKRWNLVVALLWSAVILCYWQPLKKQGY